MKVNKFALLIAFAITSAVFFEVAARADEANQSTKFTFSQPIAIPGRILPAGTYLFKLTASNDRDLVQIFSADGTRLYATVQTVVTERRKATGDTVVTVAEQPEGGPDALLKWFYPGNTIGHEFGYSKQEKQQVAECQQQTIVAKETAEPGN